MKRFRKKLNKTVLKNSLIVAPDLSKLSTGKTNWFLNFLRDTIRHAGRSLDAGSFHQYYLPKNASAIDLTSPPTLDSFEGRILDYQKVVNKSGRPGEYKRNCRGCSLRRQL